VLLASAVAGLIALNTFGGTALAADKTDDGKVKCYPNFHNSRGEATNVGVGRKARS
jgi:uncharacterized membrane protein